MPFIHWLCAKFAVGQAFCSECDQPVIDGGYGVCSEECSELRVDRQAW